MYVACNITINCHTKHVDIWYKYVNEHVEDQKLKCYASWEALKEDHNWEALKILLERKGVRDDVFISNFSSGVISLTMVSLTWQEVSWVWYWWWESVSIQDINWQLAK